MLPKVKVSLVSLRDSVLSTYKRRHTEVTERSVVSVLGILPELDSQFPELVNWDITTELKPTRRFTESEKVVILPMLPLQVMLLIRLLLLWVVSPTTVLSTTTSL